MKRVSFILFVLLTLMISGCGLSKQEMSDLTNARLEELDILDQENEVNSKEALQESVKLEPVVEEADSLSSSEESDSGPQEWGEGTIIRDDITEKNEHNDLELLVSSVSGKIKVWTFQDPQTGVWYMMSGEGYITPRMNEYGKLYKTLTIEEKEEMYKK